MAVPQEVGLGDVLLMIGISRCLEPTLSRVIA